MSISKPFHHSNWWFSLLLLVNIAITAVRANQEYDYGEEDFGEDGHNDYYDIGQEHKHVNLPPPAKTNYYEQLGRLVAHKRARQMLIAKAKGVHRGDVDSQSSTPSSLVPTTESSTLSTVSSTEAPTNATNEVMTTTAESTSSTVNSSAISPSSVNSSELNSSGMSSETLTTSTTTVPATSSLGSIESTQAEQIDDSDGNSHGLLWLLLVLVGVCTCGAAANYCPIPTLPGGKRKSTGAGALSSMGADTEKGTTGEQSTRFSLLSQYTSSISSGRNTGGKKVTPSTQTSTPVTPKQSNKTSSSSTDTTCSGQTSDSSKKTQETSNSPKVAIPVVSPESAESHKPSHCPVLSQYTGTNSLSRVGVSKNSESAAPDATKTAVGTQNGGGPANEKPRTALVITSTVAGAATTGTNTPTKL